MKKTIFIISFIWIGIINAQHLDFDDSASESFYVSDNGDNDLDVNSEWTFEAWVIIDNRPSGTYPLIMDRRGVFSMYVQACTNCGGNYSIAFVRRNTSDDIIAKVSSDQGSVEDLSFDSKVHIAVSRDGSTTRLFINGVLNESSPDTDFNLPNDGSAVNFGARYWGSYQRHLDGEIDEIRISDNARYTSNFTPVDEHTTDGNTKLLLHLNEGSGTSITDASVNFTGLSLNNGDQIPDWINWSIPIELKSFSANRNGNNIKLNWTTLSETNNKGFEIQRSSDATNWEVIYFVEGQGASREEVNYNFLDKNPMSNNYYRLNQVDFDGKNTHSDVLSVIILKENKVSIYPNPTNGFVNIIGINTNTDYLIYNKLGKVVSQGNTNNKIEVSGLNTGIYYLKINGETYKIVKQ